MKTSTFLFAAFATLFVVACGSSEPAAKGPNDSPSTPSVTNATKKSSDQGVPSGVVASTPPAPPKRERIKMYNSCNKPVRLYFKRNGADLQTSLNTSTHTEESATDGDVIQLMDDTGRNEVDKITITAQMNEVVIANGCTKFEAK